MLPWMLMVALTTPWAGLSFLVVGALDPRIEGRCLLSAFDDIKGKAAGLISGREQSIKNGIEKAGDIVDRKTGDKFKGHVDSVQKAASGFVDGAANNPKP